MEKGLVIIGDFIRKGEDIDEVDMAEFVDENVPGPDIA
jgi:hypothetical protein